MLHVYESTSRCSFDIGNLQGIHNECASVEPNNYTIWKKQIQKYNKNEKVISIGHNRLLHSKR